MAELQRNFRSAYLEKVGKKGVEEKKSLELILKDKQVDVVKLEQFCLRFPLPATYRTYVWKILLGISPTHQDISEFVHQQREQQYNDLKMTLTVMHRINQDTPVPHIHLRMFLVQQGQLPLKENNMFDDEANNALLALSAGVCQIEDDPVDSYWLTNKIFLLQHQVKHLLPSMCEQLVSYVKREDTQLYTHLSNTCSVSAIPAKHWIMSCYATTLPESAFERVCDRVVGGTFQLLVFVGVSVLITMRRQIMSKNNTEDMIKILEKLPEESADMIILKALELWQKHGCPLSLATCPSDSPTPLSEPHV